MFIHDIQLALSSSLEYSLSFRVWNFLDYLKNILTFHYWAAFLIMSIHVDSGTTCGNKTSWNHSCSRWRMLFPARWRDILYKLFLSLFCFHVTRNHICFSCGCRIMNRYLSQTFHEFPNVLDPQRILQLEKHMRSLEYFCLWG